VRDALLARPNTDLDLVLAGDATALAEKLAEIRPGKLTVHRRFGTATLTWEDGSADLATARAESYARPGALPDVRPGTIDDDLARRDFTINAMAVELNPRHYGELLDPFHGRQDLADRLVRILHANSFVDDATRIWRALRYEQRLDFTLEPGTLKLLERDIDRLDNVSGDRIRHELELALREPQPEKVLKRADGLGVLARLHPALKFDVRQAGRFDRARRENRPVPEHLYLALLCWQLNGEQMEQVIDYLHLPGAAARVLRESAAIKGRLDELGDAHGPAPSRVYELLHGYTLAALKAGAIGASAVAAEQIELYLNVLSHVNPALSGEDIKGLGVPEGPRIQEIIRRLREARLDGTVDSKEGEEALVRDWLEG
jgi:tRNA nucleotidyltransferase (CCA-adding enzyme)